jgi:hypothetical protein
MISRRWLSLRNLWPIVLSVPLAFSLLLVLVSAVVVFMLRTYSPAGR